MQLCHLSLHASAENSASLLEENLTRCAILPARPGECIVPSPAPGYCGTAFVLQYAALHPGASQVTNPQGQVLAALSGYCSPNNEVQD